MLAVPRPEARSESNQGPDLIQIDVSRESLSLPKVCSRPGSDCPHRGSRGRTEKLHEDFFEAVTARKKVSV
jgi:hypothetical protein